MKTNHPPVITWLMLLATKCTTTHSTEWVTYYLNENETLWVCDNRNYTGEVFTKPFNVCGRILDGHAPPQTEEELQAMVLAYLEKQRAAV